MFSCPVSPHWGSPWGSLLPEGWCLVQSADHKREGPAAGLAPPPADWWGQTYCKTTRYRFGHPTHLSMSSSRVTCERDCNHAYFQIKHTVQLLTLNAVGYKKCYYSNTKCYLISIVTYPCAFIRICHCNNKNVSSCIIKMTNEHPYRLKDKGLQPEDIDWVMV